MIDVDTETVADECEAPTFFDLAERARRSGDPELLRQLADRIAATDPNAANYLYGPCAAADPEAWFPERGQPNTEARKVCNGDPARRSPTQPCPVRDTCLAAAFASGSGFGVWGGWSGWQRRKLIDQIRAALEAAA